LGWINCMSSIITETSLNDSNHKFDLTKTNVIDILGWPSGFIKMIKKSEFNLAASKKAYDLFKIGYELNFISEFMKSAENLENTRQLYENISESKRYFEDTKILQNRIMSSFKDPDPYDYLTMLKDYLRMANDLKVEIKGKEIAKGGELITEDGEKSSKMKMHHDNMSREYSLAKDKILTQKFIDVVESYKPHVEYNIKTDEEIPEEKLPKYIFTVPKTPFDLEEEGRTLGHCVGSYSKRVSQDDCLIILMRERKNKNAPLLTIELYNTSGRIKINQVQGKSRRQPNAEEQAEIDNWLNYLNSNGFQIKRSHYYKELNEKMAEEQKSKELLEKK
jgi:hypothetical protein